LLALTALPAAGAESDRGQSQLSKINHIVVIYQENHSFDNLYGGWEGVNGRSPGALGSMQINQAGNAYTCLLQNDVNLTSSDPLPTTCVDETAATKFNSHFTNAPFGIEAYIPSIARTCPQPGAFFPFGSKPSSTNLPG